MYIYNVLTLFLFNGIQSHNQIKMIIENLNNLILQLHLSKIEYSCTCKIEATWL